MKYLKLLIVTLLIFLGAGAYRVNAQSTSQPVGLIFDPVSNNEVLNQDFQVNVILQASTNSVNSLYFKIDFNSDRMRVKKFEINSDSGLALTSAPISNSQGYMEFKGTRAFGSTKIISGDVVVGTITFTPASVGEGVVRLEKLEAGSIDHPLLPLNSAAQLGTSGFLGDYIIDIAKKTTKVRVAETQDGLSNPRVAGNSTGYVEYDYTDSPTRVRYTFAKNTPGQKTLFVCFVDNKGNCQLASATPALITYSPNPSLSSITCEYDPKGTGTRVTVLGSNFGAHAQQGGGSVNIGGTVGTITDWSEVPIATSATPTAAVASASATASSSGQSSATESASQPPVLVSSQSRVVAAIPGKIDGSQAVLVTLDDGRFIAGSCAIDTSSVSFTAKLQCRPPDNLAEKDVRVQIVQDGASIPSYDQKISLDASGLPQWTGSIPKLEVGKNYRLVIKAPKTVSLRQNFTASTGTTVLDDLSLPVGDIFPLTTPDNVINSSDYSELVREWTTTSDTTRAGDFNLDNRVNSLDYSCLVQNFGKTGESFVK